jgi:hypothetical protein
MSGFMEWLTGRHTRECGAVYEVRATRTPFPDTDDAPCEVRGRVMDNLRQSTSFRSYELVSRPDED